MPIGLLCGLFLAESDGRIAAAVRFTADVMTGVPSITIGIFGYIAIVKNTGGYSGLAGAFAIGIIMLPVIMRAGETAIRGVPLHLNEAALALGARQGHRGPAGGRAGRPARHHHRGAAGRGPGPGRDRTPAA